MANKPYHMDRAAQAIDALPRLERRLSEALNALSMERNANLALKQELAHSRSQAERFAREINEQKDSHRETLENVALVYIHLGGDLCITCDGSGAETPEMVEMRGTRQGYRQREYLRAGDRIDEMCGTCEGIGYMPPKERR